MKTTPKFYLLATLCRQMKYKMTPIFGITCEAKQSEGGMDMRRAEMYLVTKHGKRISSTILISNGGPTSGRF